MDDNRSKQRYRGYLKEELQAAALYKALSDAEEDPERSNIFLQLVDAEMRHAKRWADKLGLDSVDLKPGRLDFLGNVMRYGAKILGTKAVLPILMRIEAREISAYTADPEARDLVLEERSHSQILNDLSRSKVEGRPVVGGRSYGRSGNLQASVLGFLDGLVSNFCLVMGVAGGTGEPHLIFLAGIAGLLAGSFSMATGEYASMRAQRDSYENDIAKEAIELAEWPEEELEELNLIYRAKGLSEDEADKISRRVMADPEVALDTMAREEVGLDPSSLGSPWSAAFSSLLAFSLGALVPILPFVLTVNSDPTPNIVFLSAGLSGFLLIVLGGILAFLSGNRIWVGSIRMLLLGGLAATVTYTVGLLIGVSVSGLG